MNDLLRPETNGPANILRIVGVMKDDIERGSTEDQLALLDDIECQASLILSYLKEIRAVICPEWHDIIRQEEEKKARYLDISARQADRLSTEIFNQGADNMRGKL
jgi:hypothetical protein